MLVKDIMNKNIVTAEPGMSVREAARLMTDNRVGSVVVLRNCKPVGILTERNVLLAVANDITANMDSLRVEDLMTRWLITITPESTIEKAVGLMAKNKIKKLPVMKNGRLVGIITSSDIAVIQPQMIKKLAKMVSHK